MEYSNIQGSILYLITEEKMDELLKKAINQAKAETSEPKPEERLLTREEAAKMLSVDVSTLWRWEKEGHLLPSRIGKRIYYKYSEIQRITER